MNVCVKEECSIIRKTKMKLVSNVDWMGGIPVK